MINNDSGVKFFDRKFVALHLRSQLRCPQCLREYSHKHSTGATAENYQPFLLPCGHNLCEYCLTKHRQQMLDFKCVVCSSLAPPTFNAKDSNAKSAGNIRDYYEPNYHVLGETNSLEYYRRQSVETFNKSLDLPPMSEIILETKCSECSRCAATGECQQCNAFYCKRCFDTVHNFSRVLKTHSFQRLPVKRTSVGKGVRVGRDVFRMPQLLQCSRHNMLSNIYCHKCKYTGCKVCVSQFHVGHKTCTVGHMNQRYADEIPASISSLDSALLQINNAQLVVKNTKKKLGDFAADTLAKISNRFRLLHGQLQNAELAIIETLRESGLPPQMQLNEAMRRLNSYEMILKNLRQMLHCGDDDRIGVPQDFWLRDLLSLINEHLEKIPSSVYVSKIDTNPYQSSITKDNLLETIDQYFTCNFVDPKMEVHFNNEYDHRSIISAISLNSGQTRQGRTNKKLSFSGKKQRRFAKKSNAKSSSSSDSEFKDDPEDLMNSFSAMEINNSSESMSQQVADWFKTGALVRVRSVKSPEDFYVQCIQAAQRIHDNLAAVTGISAFLPAPFIVVGQQYIIYHDQSSVDRWHRGLVSQKTEKRHIYNVFLPDIGLNCQVHSSNFRGLPESLAGLPYAAVHCSLNQLMPNKGGSEWELEANDFLKQVVQNNSVRVTVMRALGPQSYEVDLITNNYGANISVREAFLYSGFARARNHYAPSQLLRKEHQLVALQSQRFPKYQPCVGDISMVQIMEVEHPQEFYVISHNFESKWKELQSELQRVMDKTSLCHLEPIYLGRLQLKCALLCEGLWYRVSIEQILPEGYVVVRQVDFGTTQKVYWDQLFKLPDAFGDREMAIRCSLADVETLQENGYSWTKTAIATFKQICSNPSLQMEVIHVKDNVAHVSLDFIRTSSGLEENYRSNSNVAVQLVAQGHCQSSGGSSKIMQPMLKIRPELDEETHKLIEQSRSQVEYQKTNIINPSKTEPTCIEVLYVLHPGEFYVTLSRFSDAIVELRKNVQDTAAAMFERCQPKQLWIPGEMCFVRTKAEVDLEVLWHRGQIVNVVEGEAFEYNVHLRDIGEQVMHVSFSNLAPMDDILLTVANNSIGCQLYGIASKEANSSWSPEAIEFFKAQLQAYSSLHVSGHGRKGNYISVTLLGCHTEITGPFSPTRNTYVSINDTLVMAGWAVKDSGQPQVEPLSASHSTLCSESDVDEELKACLEAVDRITEAKAARSTDAPQPSNELDFQHTDEMPAMELLQDFNADTTTTGYAEAPAAWLEPRECNKYLFTAVPTYVNENCEIYLSLASDVAYMDYMRKLLNQRFKAQLGRQKENLTYVVGQPVVVVYHLDNLLYRGIVRKKSSVKEKYLVYYVDYGNEEIVGPADLLPYAPFPQLNALCWRISLHGIECKVGQKYSRISLDTVHKYVVMRLCSVRVMERKGSNGLPHCQIKMNHIDIASMMVDNDMAERLSSNKKQLAAPPPPSKQVLDSFKLFDELLLLGEPQLPVEQHNNTTVQPPPAKKKYIQMNSSRELLQLDSQKDSEMLLELTSDCFKVDKNNEDSSYDYIVEEMIEGIANEEADLANEDEINSAAEPEESGFVPPSGPTSAMDQVRHRIQLRYKEMVENSHFSPMDTSTERSYHDGVGYLKSQTLPSGVKQFKCSIDKVLSATELQISPHLTEFSKQEIGLTHETIALIREAPQLVPVVDALCMARYSQDNHWYRGIVRELNQSAQQATVFYIDFHDTEMVPYANLKVMPKELYLFPQRSFRVRLHRIKMNKNFGETSVRHSLQACLCKHPLVFARVHFPDNYHSNNDDCSGGGSEPHSCSDSMRRGFKLLEVDIYENKQKSELLYKPLIDSRMYFFK